MKYPKNYPAEETKITVSRNVYTSFFCLQNASESSRPLWAPLSSLTQNLKMLCLCWRRWHREKSTIQLSLYFRGAPAATAFLSYFRSTTINSKSTFSAFLSDFSPLACTSWILKDAFWCLTLGKPWFPTTPKNSKPETDLIDQKCRRRRRGRCARCSGWFWLRRGHSWRARGRETSRAARPCCWSQWETACRPWPGGSFRASARVLGDKDKEPSPLLSGADAGPPGAPTRSPLSLS